MENWKTVTIASAVILVTFFVMIYVIKVQSDSINELKAIRNEVVEMKVLSNGVVRGQSAYVTSDDFRRFIESNGIKWNELNRDLRDLKAEVVAVGVTRSRTPGYSGSNLPSTTTTVITTEIPSCPDGSPCPNPWNRLNTTERFQLSEPFSDSVSVPIGEVAFTTSNENPWDVIINPRDYNLAYTISRDENQRVFVHSRFSISTNGEEYTIPIEADVKQEYPHMRTRFAPRPYIGAGAGFGKEFEVAPIVLLSLANRGVYNSSPDFTILDIGLSYGNNMGLSLSIIPGSYNIGKPIPWFDNIHILPIFSINMEGQYAVLAGVVAGL